MLHSSETILRGTCAAQCARVISQALPMNARQRTTPSHRVPEQTFLTYPQFKFLHILGVVLLIGNVTVTAVWKVFADRTGQATIVAFAQRLVTYTDWAFTLGGVALLMIGGYGMAITSHLPLFGSTWLGRGSTHVRGVRRHLDFYSRSHADSTVAAHSPVLHGHADDS